MPEPQKDGNKITSEDASGGGTAPTAYRKPNGDSPHVAGDPLVLPPGIDSGSFKEFTLRAAKIVGDTNITIITNQRSSIRRAT